MYNFRLRIVGTTELPKTARPGRKERRVFDPDAPGSSTDGSRNRDGGTRVSVMRMPYELSALLACGSAGGWNREASSHLYECLKVRGCVSGCLSEDEFEWVR